MPFIETSPETLPLAPQPIGPGGEPEPAEFERGEALDAAIRLHNPLFNAYQYLSDRAGLSYDPDHNPIDIIGGTKFEAGYLDRFVDSFSEADTRLRMQRIDEEEEQRKTLGAAGVPGMVASVAAGLVDPTLLLPAGTIYRSIKGGRAALKTGASVGAATAGQAAISEAILYGAQQTRTLEESTLAVGSAAILGGILGGAIGVVTAKELSRLNEVMDAYRKQLNEDMFRPNVAQASAGAAGARREGLTLESALGAEKALGPISPVTRLQQSEFEAARATVRDLADAGLAYKENWEGIPTSEGGTVETRVKMWRGPAADATERMDDAYARYFFDKTEVSKWERATSALRASWAQVRGQKGGKLTAFEFRQEVGKAMRRNDEHPIPQVAEAAKHYREKVFEPLKQAAIKAGLLSEDVKAVGAESYIMRMYNREKIKSEREQWTQALLDHLKGKRKTDLARQAETDAFVEKHLAGVAEKETRAAIRLFEQGATPEAITKRLEEGALEKEIAATELRPGFEPKQTIPESLAKFDDSSLRNLVEEVTNTILGESAFRLPGLSIVQGPRGPLKERVLKIPDEVLEPWLHSDIERVSRAYVKTMAPDVELSAKFGDVTMKEQIQRLTDELNQKMSNMPDGPEKVKLQDRYAAARRDLEALRDRLRGTYALPDDPDSFMYRAGKVALNMNYLARMGGVTISSIPDLFRPIGRYGLNAFRDGWIPWVEALGRKEAGFRLAAREARLAGTAIDMIRDQRLVEMSDIIDDFGRNSKFERGVAWAADRFGHVTLMSPWNTALKGVSAVVTMAEVLRAAKAVAAGKGTAKQIRNLAMNGIDEGMAKRVWAEAEKSGNDVDGVFLPNTEDWTDLKAVDALRAAINREAENLIVTPGLEKPLWASKPLGRILGQFKSFSMVSTQRIMLQGLQQRDAAALSSVVGLLALGAFSGMIKGTLRGDDVTEWDAERWVSEAADGSGLFGVLTEANQISKRLFDIGLGAPVGRYGARNELGTILGPTSDFALDAFRGARGVLPGGKGTTRGDMHALRKITPLQNLFYTRRLFDLVEEGAGDVLGLPARKPYRRTTP